jgi:hypothetical protein
MYTARQQPSAQGKIDVPYSEFKQLIATAEVEKVVLRDNQATVYLKRPVPVGAN